MDPHVRDNRLAREEEGKWQEDLWQLNLRINPSRSQGGQDRRIGFGRLHQAAPALLE